MRIFVIKHRGATNWQNMRFEYSLELSNGYKCYASKFFFRKKDAKAYLETLEYKEYLEVVGATVDVSNADNRRSS